MPDDNGLDFSFLYWTPTLVGAGIAAKRAFGDIREMDFSGAFSTGRPGDVAAAHAAAMGTLARGRANPATYIERLREMATSGAWRGALTDEAARRAVLESMRASLLASSKATFQQINAWSRAIINPLGAPIAGSSTQANIFQLALQHVEKYGDPAIFLNTMTAITERGYAPGVYFGKRELRSLYQQAAQKGFAPIEFGRRKTSDLYWYRRHLKPQEVSRLETWMNAFVKEGPEGIITEIERIHQYPGDVRMAQVKLWMPGMPISAHLNLPLHTSVYRRAASEYIMHPVYSGLPLEGGELMAWGDYYAQGIRSSLLPQLQQIASESLPTIEKKRLIKERVRLFDEQMSRYLTWTPRVAHPGQQFINDLNSYIVGAPELSEIGARQAAVRPDLDLEFGALYKQGYYPASSGTQILAGKFMREIDPRMFWAYGADFPIERRPMQFIREFFPTEKALRQMRENRILGVFRRDIPFMGTHARRVMAERGVGGMQFVVGYAVPGTPAAEALATAGLAKEELLIEKGLMGMFETERFSTINLGMREAIGNKGLKKWLAAAATTPPEELARHPYSVTPGELLGYELQTGKPIYGAQIDALRQEIVGVNLAKTPEMKEAVQLIVRETHRANDYVKIFGSLKATTRARGRDYIRAIKEMIGGGLGARHAEAFTYIEELTKNRALLREQMASGLAFLARQRIHDIDVTLQNLQAARAANRGRAMAAFDTRLGALLTKTNEIALSEMKRFLAMRGEQVAEYLPNELEMLRKAKAWGLDVRLIGGALPHTKFLTEAELAEARKIAGPGGLVHPSGVVLGMATGHVGAYRHTWGGGIIEQAVAGSMEPRGIMQLLEHKWNVRGTNVAELLTADIIRSMPSTTPAIAETLNIARSLTGAEFKDLPVVQAVYKRGLEVRPEPYMLDLGVPIEAFGGKSTIYVPSEGTLKRLRKFRTDTGQIAGADLQRAYDRLIKMAGQTKILKDTTTANQMLNEAAASLSETVMNELGAGMFGRGRGSDITGALRGKMTGAAFVPLSSVDLMEREARDFTVELSEYTAKQMFKEMERAAITDADRAFITGQRKAFMAGETVYGMVMRHPFIGPYSIQPTAIRKAIGPTTKTEHLVRLPAETLKAVRTDLFGEMKVNVNPLLGMAADFDDDRLIVKMIGDKKTASATAELLRPQGTYIQEYTRFATEATIMKQAAKRQLGPAAQMIDDIDKLIMGSAKLRITAAETAPISAALTEAKLAMSYYNPAKAAKFNIMAEMLEQQIISGKKMQSLSQNIARDVAISIKNMSRGQDLEELVKITRNIFGPELERGINVEIPGMAPYRFQLNYQQMWEDAATAFKLGEEKSGILTRYRVLARGRINKATVDVAEVIRMVESAAAGKADTLSNLAAMGVDSGIPQEGMSRAAGRTIQAINETTKKLGSASKTWTRPVSYTHLTLPTN